MGSQKFRDRSWGVGSKTLPGRVVASDSGLRSILAWKLSSCCSFHTGCQAERGGAVSGEGHREGLDLYYTVEVIWRYPLLIQWSPTVAGLLGRDRPPRADHDDFFSDAPSADRQPLAYVLENSFF